LIKPIIQRREKLQLSFVSTTNRVIILILPSYLIKLFTDVAAPSVCFGRVFELTMLALGKLYFFVYLSLLQGVDSLRKFILYVLETFFVKILV